MPVPFPAGVGRTPHEHVQGPPRHESGFERGDGPAPGAGGEVRPAGRGGQQRPQRLGQCLRLPRGDDHRVLPHRRSDVPGVGRATHGSPSAIASSSASGNASCREDRQNTSRPARKLRTSAALEVRRQHTFDAHADRLVELFRSLV
ncbi:hypothetical protein FHR93_005287 [Geodermatophilus sabuli]|nr:hypothetical protein [Geodermatophilus sabuli]